MLELLSVSHLQPADVPARFSRRLNGLTEANGIIMLSLPKLQILKTSFTFHVFQWFGFTPHSGNSC